MCVFPDLPMISWFMNVLQFLLDPLVEHEVMQMWKFCPVRQMPWASDGLG